MRVSISYNRTRVRIMDNAEGAYFLYSRPFGKFMPKRCVFNNGRVVEASGFTQYVLASLAMPGRVYIICETGKEEPR